jgi:flavin-binding protein dodecin
MPDSVYKVIELVGSSPTSWEEAASNAVNKASESLHDLRIAEVVAQDMHIEEGKVVLYRTRLKLSFKFQS